MAISILKRAACDRGGLPAEPVERLAQHDVETPSHGIDEQACKPSLGRLAPLDVEGPSVTVSCKAVRVMAQATSRPPSAYGDDRQDRGDLDDRVAPREMLPRSLPAHLPSEKPELLVGGRLGWTVELLRDFRHRMSAGHADGRCRGGAA